MSYHDKVSALAGEAEQMEQVYHAALKAGEGEAFRQAIDDSHRSAPENLLYAAWFHRLKYTAAQAKGHVTAWAWVIPLAVANGLLFWWLSDGRFVITIRGYRGTEATSLPVLSIWAMLICAVLVLVYLTAVGRKRWGLSAFIGVFLLAAGGYVLLTYPQTGTVPFQEQYLTLMVMHLPLLAWAAVGAFLVAGHRDPTNRFSFLIKSLEVFILPGMYVVALGLFTAITIGLFAALDVDFPEVLERLFLAGGLGVIPVVATAVVYNPTVPPAEQSFDQGLPRLVALLMRVMLPLTLLVLLVYLVFIPFNFRAPFDKREVLIIYNGMLFAVVALLVGATPVSQAELSLRLARWLRRGIIAVAALALIVSLYALAAILYRTDIDGLTPNRLTFIGWNVVNIGLLILVLLFQVRPKDGRWLHGFHRAYSAGTIAYAIWTLVVILAIPWLFGIDQRKVEALPISVQKLVFEQPAPILLKCADSPHIYLLGQGEKRWIEDIETFNDRGYVWGDVQWISCDDLRQIPDGVPIPADAGPPPQP
jgi:hypothetical protein